MKRFELEKNQAIEYRNTLEKEAELIEELYESHYIHATLYQLGPIGAVIEIQWKRFDQYEFMILEPREADEMDTFIWALADFEWLVINPDERMQLQRLLISLGTRGIQTA
jgi:hypothetical protein